MKHLPTSPAWRLPSFLTGGLLLVWLTLPVNAGLAADSAAAAGEGARAGVIRLSKLGNEAVDLKVQAVQEKPVASEVVVPGNIVAIPHSEYKQHSVIPGRVSMRLAGLGDAVRLGQELARIDSPDINRLAAETLQSRAQLQAEIAHSQAVLDDEVNQAVSRHRLATANYQRIKMLYSERILARKDLDAALSELEVADTRLEAATRKRRLVLAALHEKLKLTMEPLKHRLSLLGLSEADIERILREKRTVVSVPIRSSHQGLVTKVDATPGQSIDPSNTLFVVCDLSRVWIRANVYEPDIARISKGQKVIATVTALPGEQFAGTLSYLASQVDPDLRTLSVCAELPNAGLKLKPGMYGQVRIQTSRPSKVVLIPADAVVQQRGKAYVLLETPDGFQARPVEVGRSFGNLVEIREGLSSGEKIVVEGAFQVGGEVFKVKPDQPDGPGTEQPEPKTGQSGQQGAQITGDTDRRQEQGDRYTHVWLFAGAFVLGVALTLIIASALRARRANTTREQGGDG